MNQSAKVSELSKKVTTINIQGKEMDIDVLDVWLIERFKKYSKHYKHIITGNEISVEEYYFRFASSKERTLLYANGETRDDYKAIDV